MLNRFVAEKKIAGAVAAVARRGKLAYLEAVGVQDLETRAPMTDRSLFRIYSMTKPVTAVAAMMLHEEGRFASTIRSRSTCPSSRTSWCRDAGRRRRGRRRARSPSRICCCTPRA